MPRKNPLGQLATRPVSAEEYQKKVAREMYEDTLRENIRGLAVSLGWRIHFWWNSKHSPAGFPDLVLIHAKTKRIIFRELKRSGSLGKISKAQQACMDDLTAVGMDVKVWRPEDWLDGTIEAELRAA